MGARTVGGSGNLSRSFLGNPDCGSAGGRGGIFGAGNATLSCRTLFNSPVCPGRYRTSEPAEHVTGD